MVSNIGNLWTVYGLDDTDRMDPEDTNVKNDDLEKAYEKDMGEDDVPETSKEEPLTGFDPKTVYAIKVTGKISHAKDVSVRY